MAWINNRWLDDDEREKEYQIYDEYFKMAIFPVYGYEPNGWPPEARERWIIYSRLERVRRCKDNQLEFAIEYFSEARNPGNAGNWDGFELADKEDAAEFHIEITDIMNEVSTIKKNAKTAVAAPRSHAKSTYLTKNFPIHQVVYRLRKYIIVISETPSVSGPNLEWLATQLKHNEKLRRDFGALLSPRQQENVRDNNAEFIAWEDRGDGMKRQLTKVEAASTGQALRGRNWNGTRPDLIVCDDLEDAKTNAATEEQRTKLRDWFSSVVVPLGDPKGEKTAIIYMGTTVHFDSLLMHILYRRSDFTTRIYRALINAPKRSDLWEQCREIYQDYDNKTRKDDAVAFYHANKDAMDEGSRVLWPEFQSLWKLMTWRWDNGSKAFNTEYQNNPIDEESMIFNPETFTYWDDNEPTKQFPHADYTISMGVDMALGKQRGDYSAVVTTARHKETDVVYVIDAWGDRVHPDNFIEVITDKVIEFEPDVIGAEAVAAQEFFVDKLKEYLQARGYPSQRRVKKIYNRSRKELRIESMLPDIETNKIIFSRRHTLLLEQLERYGQGAADDMPDACEISIRVSKDIKRPIRQKPWWG